MRWLWALPLVVACGNIDAQCGDAVVDDDEVCDDGNTVSGDGCASNCQTLEVCGNALLDLGEVCDDGNLTGGDGCAFDCSREEACGDNVLQAEFAPARVGPNLMVGFSTSTDETNHPRGAALARALTGVSGALPDTFGMAADELAELMNLFRQRALAAKDTP